MKPAISQVCTLASPFDKDVEDYAAGACRVLEIWLGKLETYLERHSTADARRLLEANGVESPVASFQGGLFAGEPQAQQEHWKHFFRRLALCREMEIGTLVIAGDIAGPPTGEALDRARSVLEQAAAEAAKHQVRLALEFTASAAVANNLETAAALVADVDSPCLGLCLDVFEFYLGPSKHDDLAHLCHENLFHVQLSDLAGIPRELAADTDRILPGDGDFDLASIIGVLGRMDYPGCVSLEVMNPQLWRAPARQFSEIGMTALRKLLGQASMG